ncbi:MAG: hypothetical protein V3V08_09255 [Nannocystaceae bacterium]
MQKAPVQEETLEAIVISLASFNGYRSLWRDTAGRLVHAEPDDCLEDAGFRHVITLIQPTREALVCALAGALPFPDRGAPPVVTPRSAPHEESETLASVV